MDYTWSVPVAIVLAGATYAIFARYFAHKERMAAQRTTEQQAGEK